MTRDYLDFELNVEPVLNGYGYTVTVMRSPMGVAKETVIFPFDGSQLELRLKDLEIALSRLMRMSFSTWAWRCVASTTNLTPSPATLPASLQNRFRPRPG